MVWKPELPKAWTPAPALTPSKELFRLGKSGPGFFQPYKRGAKRLGLMGPKLRSPPPSLHLFCPRTQLPDEIKPESREIKG
jgi:hypothetical protein